MCYIPAVRLWFVTRYDDVEFVGTHPELFSAELDDSPVDRTFGSPTILTVDGAPHLELRRSLDSKYRPKHVNGYIDDAEPILDTLTVEAIGIQSSPARGGGSFQEADGGAAQPLHQAALGPPPRSGEDAVNGPALIFDASSTIVIEPGWRAERAGDGTLVMTRAVADPMRRAAG